MRTKMVYCRDIKTAQYLCPWGIKFVATGGGYMVFENINDYVMWEKQKC